MALTCGNIWDSEGGRLSQADVLGRRLGGTEYGMLLDGCNEKHH
jgi:hypothetical protein